MANLRLVLPVEEDFADNNSPDRNRRLSPERNDPLHEPVQLGRGKCNLSGGGVTHLIKHLARLRVKMVGRILRGISGDSTRVKRHLLERVGRPGQRKVQREAYALTIDIERVVLPADMWNAQCIEPGPGDAGAREFAWRIKGLGCARFDMLAHTPDDKADR